MTFLPDPVLHRRRSVRIRIAYRTLGRPLNHRLAGGAEVRRHRCDIVLDGQDVGAVAMSQSIEISISPGSHTVQIHSGRDSSNVVTFAAVDGETVAYRCTGNRFLLRFLASVIDPDLALALVPEHAPEGIEG